MKTTNYDKECYKLYHDPKYTAEKQLDPKVRKEYIKKCVALNALKSTLTSR